MAWPKITFYDSERKLMFNNLSNITHIRLEVLKEEISILLGVYYEESKGEGGAREKYPSSLES